MFSFTERVVGALKGDERVFEEVEADKTALPQALMVVGATAVAAAIGSAEAGAVGIGFGLVGALMGWVLSSAVIYFVGVHVMPEPTTKADVPELMRVLGFAAAPSLLRVLGIIPFFGAIAIFLSAVWGLYVYVIAVKGALDYQSTGRAFAVCLLATLVNLAIFCGINMAIAGMVAVGGAIAQ